MRIVRLIGLCLIVGVGAAVGAGTRHGLTLVLPEVFAILVANGAGSFLLGFLVYEERLGDRLERRTRLLLTTGILSSFTTYSTFALQVAVASSVLAAGLIALGTYSLGFLGVLVGRSGARYLGASP
ncbi:MAG: CrcB family protein [Natrialbaceae archaeon]|nr:CrcB family protein [Natrialbaceae archaeon]